MKKNDFLICGLIMIFSCGITFGKNNAICTKQDELYLRKILQQTWAYLDAHLAKETGFPTDSQKAGGTTNTTNIGLYLAAIGPAEKLGFITRKDALQRIDRIITSLEKIESRNGFLHNWIDVSGKTEMPDGVLAVSDFNKLVTGLILVRQFFPEIAHKASPLIERVKWGRLYDTASGKTYWGYNAKSDTPVGLGNFWLASDCRLVAFYMIASGAAPAELWDRLTRNKIHADGLTFYEPGYRFGGLFMAAMDAIFLNELATEMGSSIADLAWHQIRESKHRGLKVWGWSNCNIPGNGYTEGGFLPWWVVTPHASALVIEYYPRHVIANLRNLDAMGLRKPLTAGGKHYGFRDSVDLRTGKVDDRYLALDQAMLFLSLTNFLEQAMVRKYFANDPLVKNGIKLLGSRLEQDNNLLEKWAKRDASEPKLLSIKKPSRKNIVLNMKHPIGLTLNTNVPKSSKTNSEFTSEGLVIDFVLDEQHSEINTDITFPPIDLRNFDSIQVDCCGQSKGDFGGIRLYLYDDQGQSQYTYIDGIKPELREFNIPESSVFGMLAKPYAVNKLTIKLWATPWYYTQQYTKAKSGRLIIERITFRRK
ncbi:MAG: hypothetical protein DRP62_00160 [Planctomycetota bacterium]|nr:MAG: hypothetical protein DRP62_00160 [Planctomycetota bacterium]